MPDGRATQARYALRPHPRSYITFQRKIYLTQKLADVLNFIEDLLALTSQIAEQHTPLPVPELPEDTATPADTEGNRIGHLLVEGQRVRGGGFQL